VAVDLKAYCLGWIEVGGDVVGCSGGGAAWCERERRSANEWRVGRIRGRRRGTTRWGFWDRVLERGGAKIRNRERGVDRELARVAAKSPHLRSHRAGPELGSVMHRTYTRSWPWARMPRPPPVCIKPAPPPSSSFSPKTLAPSPAPPTQTLGLATAVDLLGGRRSADEKHPRSCARRWGGPWCHLNSSSCPTSP
jgi:hypothetical protein